MTTTGPGQEVGAEALADFFARTPRLAVAFSGGCDSSYLRRPSGAPAAT